MICGAGAESKGSVISKLNINVVLIVTHDVECYFKDNNFLLTDLQFIGIMKVRITLK